MSQKSNDQPSLVRIIAILAISFLLTALVCKITTGSGPFNGPIMSLAYILVSLLVAVLIYSAIHDKNQFGDPQE